MWRWASMKVIFIKDVKKQAKKDEIKDVKDGYAKYLIAEGLAVAYTSKSASVLNNEIEKREKDEQDHINDCNKIKNSLKDKTIKFEVKTGANDKVFGSITSKQISEELSKLGYNIDKKKIIIKNDINTLGIHSVEIALHKEVIFSINVNLTK
jgi:large subunit ribosomal protein L9